MRFTILFKNDQDSEVDVPPCMDLDEMGRFLDQLGRDGVLVGYEGLYPSSHGARLHLKGGKASVVDGPFAEAKELIAGFALVNVASKHEAIDLAEQFLRIAGQGAAEVRQAFESAVSASSPTETTATV
ncbi:YciI family protein [Longimicrobium terrae]|uniref:YCII-related domain-containing protein n=1 Tax=Longimicrobium terrae TaxID=1639882 RepID=A0A841GKX2_9BACT|nr:YciI family protein [Longimicrobium terrae]MBB4634852.1 hypothetical protein [Longimicrobium terrae]MBB6069247.1 hypothetical protein [Longimicrobium terrae]NNC31943.1 YciI family protein [Longimicrobium terrae]